MTRKKLKNILFSILKKIRLVLYRQDPDITHNLMQARTIDSRHFEQDSSPGVRVVVNICNITLTFPVNARYNSEPEQFLKNTIDDINCSPCFGKCWLVKCMKV